MGDSATPRAPGNGSGPLAGARHRAEFRNGFVVISACVVMLLVLVYVPQAQFALSPGINTALHTLSETLSIVVSVLLFSVGWHAFDRNGDTSIPLMCSAFVAVALLDLAHLMYFEGMPEFITPSGGGKAILPFLTARLVAAFALLGVAVLPGARRTNLPSRAWFLVGCLAFAVGVSAVSLAWPAAQELFRRPGGGLTPLKVGIEYLIIALNLLAGALFLRQVRRPNAFPLADLFTAACLAALSELCFTLYARTTDQYHLLGHLFKVAAYFLIYRSLFVTLVRRPYLELEAAREALERSEERYRMLLENSMDGVLLTRMDGAVIAANPAACAMFGKTLEEMIQLGTDAIVNSGGAALEQFMKERGMAPKGRTELTVKRADGATFEVEISSAAYADPAGQELASTIMRDVSERKRGQGEILRLNMGLEQRVRDRTAQLELANRDLERFSYSVAHDLRAPLAAIDGFARELHQRALPRLGEQEVHFLARIRASVARMSGMIDALLELAGRSRLELEMRDTDLSEMARHALDACRECDPSRVVSARVEPGMFVRADGRLMAVVLDNLIGNAWKFTSRQPSAEIAIGSEWLAGEQVFFVKDNGAGFDMAYADKLFGVFQRVHPEAEFPGYGIGLANVRQIIERHNGRVWAESQPGKGAIFRFTVGTSFREGEGLVAYNGPS